MHIHSFFLRMPGDDQGYVVACRVVKGSSTWEYLELIREDLRAFGSVLGMSTQEYVCRQGI